MTITVSLPDSFDIETYDGLKTFLTSHLELDTATQAQLPTLIRLAEYRLNRMMTTPWRETSQEIVTTAGVQFVSVPTYCQQVRNVLYLADDGYPLSPVVLNTLHGDFGGSSGRPQVFAISQQEIWLGPTPDAAYSLRVTYDERLAPLTDENQTNWLLSENADAYLYACILQIESFLGDDDRVPLYAAALDQAIEEINAQGNRYRSTVPTRLRSPVVV